MKSEIVSAYDSASSDTILLTAPVAGRDEEGPQASGYRGRHPVELVFGSNGLRGSARYLTDLEVYINVRGFLLHTLEIGDIVPGEKVSLAGDLRPSTDGPEGNILRAAARAITDTGLSVDYLGHMPTPALAFYSLQRKRAGIMVTAGQASFDQNGLKFYFSSGESLERDEFSIQQAIRRVRRSEYARPEFESLFDDGGMFKCGREQPLPPGNSQACFDYLCRYFNFLRYDALEGMRIIFYQHSAVGRDLMTVLLVSLGAEVIPLGRSDDYISMETESVSTGTRELLQGLVNRTRQEHGHFDAMISINGDSDRPLLGAIAPDGRLELCSGDLLGIMTADFLNADAVVVPLSAGNAVERWAVAQGTRLTKTETGLACLIEAMHEAQFQRARRVVGWEPNGGFLTATDIERDGRTLAALPSRDAALPILATLCAANERRTKLTGLFAEYQAHASTWEG